MLNGGTVFCVDRSTGISKAMMYLALETVVSNHLQPTPINNDQLSWQYRFCINVFYFYHNHYSQPMVYCMVDVFYVNTESYATIVVN